MVTFGVLPRNFGTLWETMNDTLALLCSVDNQMWTGHSNHTCC